jgi:Aspartate/tyrosine/aromatic aminotransferase
VEPCPWCSLPQVFILWPELPGDDTTFTKGLYEEQNLLILPGSYLSRDAHGSNPGKNRARIALVAPLDECIEGAERLREFLEKNYGKELGKLREAAR